MKRFQLCNAVGTTVTPVSCCCLRMAGTTAPLPLLASAARLQWVRQIIRRFNAQDASMASPGTANFQIRGKPRAFVADLRTNRSARSPALSPRGLKSDSTNGHCRSCVLT